MSDAHFNSIHREPPWSSRHGNPMVALAPSFESDRDFVFPPNYLNPHRMEKEKTEHAQEEARLGYDPYLSLWRPHLDQDDIDAPEHLIPATTDEDGEQLPDEFHVSYPFGDPYARTRSTAPYTSEPILSPRVHMNLAVASTPAAHNTGASAAKAPVDQDVINGSLETIPSHLVLRAKTQHTPRTPEWPFVRFGPGPGGHTSLLRADMEYPTPAYQDVWADLGLDLLYPHRSADGRPDADPLKEGIGESAGLPNLDRGDEPLPEEVAHFVDSLGTMGVDQFPTGFSGAFAHLLTAETERDDGSTRLQDWLAQRRDGYTYRPGGPPGKQFSWGIGWHDPGDPGSPSPDGVDPALES